MDKEIKCIVRNRTDAVASNNVPNPHIIISIFTPGDEPPDVAQNENTRGVLHFCFDDLDRQPTLITIHALGKPVLFDDEEAQRLAKWVKAFYKQGVRTVICHCDAGVSRSAGVAAALSKHFNGSDFEFFNSGGMYGGPVYTPNMLVYRKLLEALHEEEKRPASVC